MYYQIRDNVDQLSMLYSDTIALDTIAPTGSIAIDGGAEFTSSSSVTLTLTASDAGSGVYQVRYSNNGNWDTEACENFSSTKEWTLSSGEGSKTVYYQVTDRAELVSNFSDSIILESPSPTPTPTPTTTSSYPPTPTPTTTPTPSPSQSLSPSGSPTPSPEPRDGTPGIIP